MNNPTEIKRTALQLIEQPIYLKNSVSDTKKTIAGGILVAFFAFLGITIFMAGFKAEENQMALHLGGLVFIAFPILVLLFLYKTNQKIIKEANQQGIVANNNKLYNWETLKSITFFTTTSRSSVDNLNHIYMIDFHFAEGDARTTYLFSNYNKIQFIADQLQVTKQQKQNAQHQ